MTDPQYMRPDLNCAVVLVIEKAGELQAALGKTLRWGWGSTNQELPVGDRETNEACVLREINGMRAALKNLEAELSNSPK